MIVLLESYGVIYDISQMSNDISLTTEINKVSTLKLNNLKANIGFYEGDCISLIDDEADRKMFKGYIVSKKRDKAQNITIKAFDQLKELKNKETFTFKNKSATQICKTIFDFCSLKYGQLSDTGFIIDKRKEDNVEMLDIAVNALDITLGNTNKLFIIYDDFGTLQLRNIEELKTDLILGDMRLVDNFDYETSIEKDVYNKIKLYRDNKETGKREYFIVYDSDSIKKWGLLQQTKKIDESMSAEKAEAQAEMMLKNSNKLKRSLKLSCIGDTRLRAGNGIGVVIDGIGDINLSDMLLITKCTHEWKGSIHTMDLELSIPR